jgi:methanogenic corrinoid protein MtbC1
MRALSGDIAADVTDEFLRAHPDWVARYGERARLRGIEDAKYHISFLAGAFEAGAPAAFAEYARWTGRVLSARGIAPNFLAENLVQVRDSLSARTSPEALLALAPYIDEALHALAAPLPSGEPESATETAALTRAMYRQAVLAGERKAALNVINEALRGGASALDMYVDVLQSTLYDIGQMWETNKITVAHEHAATAITQFVAAHLYERLDRTAGNHYGTLLLTGLEGELHSVGAMMVADVLETRGWNVHFLGTNLPHASILDAIRERKPDCVGISATMLFNVPAVRRLVDDIRREWGSSKRIVLGGAAFRHAPGLWQELGADGHARDLREALGLLCQ